ncbi:MAG: hypothetical protein HYV68_02540 [Candidatus Taylorbacteria bacterium]|nr:hypothetical protein [Candidatus Taylorbacteria bacterium]
MKDQAIPEEAERLEVIRPSVSNLGCAYGGKRRLAERNAARFFKQFERGRAILRAARQACSDIMF